MYNMAVAMLGGGHARLIHLELAHMQASEQSRVDHETVPNGGGGCATLMRKAGACCQKGRPLN